MRRILLIVVAMAAGLAAHAQNVALKPGAEASHEAPTKPPLAQALIGLPVYSSDDQKVGQVTSIDVGEDGGISGLQAEISGFLGLGTSSVRLLSDEFEEKGDHVVLRKTAEQVRQGYEPLH